MQIMIDAQEARRDLDHRDHRKMAMGLMTSWLAAASQPCTVPRQRAKNDECAIPFHGQPPVVLMISSYSGSSGRTARVSSEADDGTGTPCALRWSARGRACPLWWGASTR